jgi:hypothetical protein
MQLVTPYTYLTPLFVIGFPWQMAASVLYSEPRANATREVAHFLVGVLKPEPYGSFIFFAITVHHHCKGIQFPFPKIFRPYLPVFATQGSSDLVVARLHDVFRAH